MDRIVLSRPFVEGVNYDDPNYNVRPRQATSMTDAIIPRGVVMQRKGWTYDGTTAVAASNAQGMWRSPFVLSDITRSVISTATGSMYIHNPSASGTAIGGGGSGDVLLPRAVYRDMQFWCFQSGQDSLLMYSGAGFNTDSGATVVTFTANRAIVTATTGTFGANVVPGSFYSVTSVTPSPANDSIQPQIWFRVVERNSSTVLTLEDFRAESGGGTMAYTDTARGLGMAYPAVEVYSAGTISFGANIAVVGGKWITGDWGAIDLLQDALLFPVAGTDADLMQGKIASIVDETHLTLLFEDNTISDKPYSVTRRLPFKDVAAHRDCLWGAGVAQYPSRVYVGPPGWNPSLPPGATAPFDASANFHSTSKRDFLMDTIDVPSPYDGDHVVAILHTDQGLLVLKNHGAYMIDGVYPVFTTRLLDQDAGCVDIKSAQNLSAGPVWAGQNGIYIWRNGRIINMTSGRIQQYWEKNFGSKISGSGYVAIGEVDSVIRVSALNSEGLVRVLIFDAAAGVWLGFHSNQACRFYHSAALAGEVDELYGLSDNFQGRPLKLSGVTDPDLLVERDGDGTKPALSATTGTNLTPEVIDEERKLIDLAVTANVYDGGSVGSTILRIDHTGGGSLRANADEATTIVNINSDTVNRNDRHYVRKIDKSGRYHQLTFSVPTFDTSAHASGAKVEISEFALTFAPTAERS